MAIHMSAKFASYLQLLQYCFLAGIFAVSCLLSCVYVPLLLNIDTAFSPKKTLILHFSLTDGVPFQCASLARLPVRSALCAAQE